MPTGDMGPMVELAPTVERLQRNRNARTAALAVAMLAGALVLGGGAGAQVGSPVGVWQTVDDESGKPKALVRITEEDGRLSGRIEKLLTERRAAPSSVGPLGGRAGQSPALGAAPPSRPDPVCEHCTDERKDQPIVGMTILKGLKASDVGWEGGEILDPNNGKTYRAKARLSDDGSRLEVRGFIGVALFGRTQTWIRQE